MKRNISTLLLLFTISALFCACTNNSQDEVISEYFTRLEKIEKQNEELNNEISELKKQNEELSEELNKKTEEFNKVIVVLSQTPTATPTATSTPIPTATKAPTFTQNEPLTPSPELTSSPTVTQNEPPTPSPGFTSTATQNNYVVSTLSQHTTSYSAQNAERQAVYFYHPVKIVFDDATVKPAIWLSSDNRVARVYSDGVVEAFSEGTAEITAYDENGNKIGTVEIFATTKADADPIGTYTDYSSMDKIFDAYRSIPFQDIQDCINNITDLVSYMIAYDMQYNMNEEGSTPTVIELDYPWIQTVGSDWLFKNGSGICHNASAASVYSLVGDYERNGIIQMSGKYGHTISWFFENGTYYVFDFTSVYGSRNYINDRYSGNVYLYIIDNLGTGETLKEAFLDLATKTNAVYLENSVIYAVELTGVDYYPAESNSWMHTGDFSQGNTVSFVEGTNVEVLYLGEGVDLEIEYVPREDTPECMRAYVSPTDSEAITMDTNYGRLRVLEAKVSSEYATAKKQSNNNQLKLSTEAKISNAYSSSELLTQINTSSANTTGQGSYVQSVLSTAASTTNSAAATTTNLSAQSTFTLLDFDGTYLFELPEGETADYYVSSDTNILRVRSDGMLKPYSEGVVTIYACKISGEIVAKQDYIVATSADNNPLAMTLESSGKLTGMKRNGYLEAVYYGKKNAYQDIAFEDIPEKLKTITDYVAWLYANYTIADGQREPQSPRPYMQVESERAMWFPMANSEWVFLDSSGVCCNFAAGADYSLCNDYEMTGRIMMNGPYGHVINYYYENNTYYVIDFTKVVEDHYMIYQEYASNVLKYVEERIGRGTTLREAYDDYMSRNDRSFYNRNIIIYSVNTSGYNFYHSECNNWSSYGIEKGRMNTLYSSTPELNEVFYVEDGYEFQIVKLEKNEISGKLQTFYSKDEPSDWEYAKYFTYCDNSKVNRDDYVNENYNDHPSDNPSGNNGGGLPNKTIEEPCIGMNYVDCYIYGLYGDDDNKFWNFWGIRDNVSDKPSVVTIEREIDGILVTHFGENALGSQFTVRDIYVPDTIIWVGNNTFIGLDMTLITFHVYEGSYMEEYCREMGYNFVYR